MRWGAPSHRMPYCGDIAEVETVESESDEWELNLGEPQTGE